MIVTLDYIKSCIDNLAKKIDAPDTLLPSCEELDYGSNGYIKLDSRGNLTYVVPGDRGDVYNEALDLNHLLFIIFKSITYIMAVSAVKKNSKPDVDPRRQRSEFQLELLGKLDKQWKLQQEEYERNIQMISPYNDYEGQKNSYL